MVNKYNVKDTQTYEEQTFLRTSTLSVPDKRQHTIAKSLDKRFMDRNVFDSIVNSNNVINEIYLNFPIDKIVWYIDHPTDLRNYLYSNSKYLSGGAINILFVNVDMGHSTEISSEHIIFLNNLLTQNVNDIYVMPTLQFDGLPKPAEIREYSKFVTKMINYKNSLTPGNLNIGLNVPSYYLESDLKGLFDLYSKEHAEPTFVSVDFNHAGIDDDDCKDTIDAINGHYKKEGIEDYFLYGFNVRTHLRSKNNPVSDEMIMARRGLNAVGAPHYSHGFGRSEPITQVNQLGTVFDRDDYRYHLLTEQKQMDAFLEWSHDFNYNFDINNLAEYGKDIKSIVPKYNLWTVNAEFFDVSYAIRKNDTDLLRTMMQKGNLPQSVASKERTVQTHFGDSFW